MKTFERWQGASRIAVGLVCGGLVLLGSGCGDHGDGGTKEATPEPVRRFEKTVGGVGHDSGLAVIQASNGDYVIAGRSESGGTTGDDLYLVRTTRDGDLIWERLYGGDRAEVGNDVLETKDRGLLVVGSTASSGAGQEDVYLVRTNAKGEKVWESTLGGTGSEVAYAVAHHPEGGFVVAGDTFLGDTGESDVYVARVNESGGAVWERSFGGDLGDFARAVVPTLDNGFLVAGFTFSRGAGGVDAYLIKIDGAGNLVWEQAYGTEGAEYVDSVVRASDGGFVLIGHQRPSRELVDGLYVVKTDCGGHLEWTQTYRARNASFGHDVLEVPGGGYLLVGQTTSHFETDAFLLRIDALGRRMFRRSIGSPQWDEVNAAFLCDDGGFVMVGKTAPASAEGDDVFLLKAGPEGFTYH